MKGKSINSINGDNILLALLTAVINIILCMIYKNMKDKENSNNTMINSLGNLNGNKEHFDNGNNNNNDNNHNNNNTNSLCLCNLFIIKKVRYKCCE